MNETERAQLVGPLLKAVSRSFYLTLRVLPAELRPAISLAYLFARASDTIADTKVVPRDKRRAYLLRFRRQFEHGVNVDELASLQADLAPHQSLPAEKLLLEKLESCFQMLATMREDDQRRIAELLDTITKGQESDLVQFPGESERELAAFEVEEQLDDYTYAVAGCVGEFWTKMCVAHLPALQSWNVKEMVALGIRFGKALQLTNILRDIPKDLQIGRCYLPRTTLAQAGLKPDELLKPGTIQNFRPLYHRYLDRTLEHMEAGWRYTMGYPPSLWRLRLACAWPILIGLKTIALLRHSPDVLDASKRVMIPTIAVYRIMAKSFVICRRDGAMNAWFQKLKAEAQLS